MGKLLVGVGIGCGAIVLLGVVAVIGGGFWVKGQIEDKVGDLAGFEAQAGELKELETRYPFEAPPKGQAPKLTEQRLQDYLAVRASVRPVFEGFEQQTQELEEQEGGASGMRAGFEAMGMMTGLIKEIRAAYIAELDRREMSPAEFSAITGAIYASYVGTGMAKAQEGHRQALEDGLARLDAQRRDTSLSAEHRELLDKQREALAESLAELPEREAALAAELPVHRANAELLERFKVQIEDAANPALDVFILASHD